MTKLLGTVRRSGAPVAMGLIGLIFGIPVFFDIGIFVLAPLVYVAAKRGGKSLVLYAMPHARRPVDDPRVPAAAPRAGRRGWPARASTWAG